MILADKIIDERKKAGWSQEELATKLGVSRQAVSKWESAQASPDLQRIVQMTDLFGVTTDYLLKDDHAAALESADSPIMKDTPLRTISLQEAQEFLDLKRKEAPRIALGVSMCILSPTPLMLLNAGACTNGLGITEEVAAALGMIALLGIIAAAVALFITYGMKLKRFEFLEKDPFDTAYGITGLVTEKKRAYEGTFTRLLAGGIALCIVSCVPLLACASLAMPDAIVLCTVALLLALVALGVNMIIRAGIINGSYEMLLQEGDYTRANKKTERKLEAFVAVYWCLTTAIFLGWSFSTMEWERSWIVWPVAAVLFAALYTFAKALVQQKEKEERN